MPAGPVFASGSPDAFDLGSALPGAPVGATLAPGAFSELGQVPPGLPFLDLSPITASPALSVGTQPAPRATTPTRTSGLASLFGSFTLNPLDVLQTVGGIGFQFYRESNRATESRSMIRAEESVALARAGFTTGRARFDTNLLQSATIPQAGGINTGLGLGSFSKYVPIALLVVVGIMVAKR